MEPTHTFTPPRPLGQADAHARVHPCAGLAVHPRTEPVPGDRPVARRYGVPAAVLAAALGVELALGAVGAERYPLAAFLGCLVFAAWYGGSGPTLLALGLSVAGLVGLLGAGSAATVRAVGLPVTLFFYALTGAAVGLLGEAARSARLRDAASRRDAADRLRRLEEEVERRRHAERQAEAYVAAQADLRALAEGQAALLTQVLDQTPVGLLVLDPSLRVVRVNAVAAALAGAPAATLVGRPLREVLAAAVPPEAAEDVMARVRAVRETGLPVAVQGWSAPLAHRPGEPFFADWSASRLADAPGGGGAGGVLLTASDVTARVVRERALAASEERFRTLADSAPVLIWAAGAEDGCTDVNRPWLDFTGRSLDRALGHGWLDDVHPDDREACRAAFAAAWADRRPFRREFRLRRRDGEYRWVLDHGAPAVAPDGTLLGYLGSCVDVTEARRLREHHDRLLRDLEDRRAFTEEVMRQAPSGIIVADAAGALLFANAEAGRIVGYEYVPGRQLADNDTLVDMNGFRSDGSRYLPDDWPLARAMRGELVQEEEIELAFGDGRRTTISANAGPIRDGSGRVVAAVVAFHDITEARRAARSSRFLAEAGARLAALVDEETTLGEVARLAVPALADWCAVDLLGDDGRLRRVAVAHADPEKMALALELHRRFPQRVDSLWGAARVARTGRAELMSEVTPGMVDAIPDPDHRRAVRGLGIRSHLAVPLTARGEVVGAVSLATAESGRRLGPDDLALAEDLARRASVAVDNARLYERILRSDRRKDDFLATLAHELRNPLAPVCNAVRLLDEVGPHGPGLEEARGVIDRQVSHLARLLDDLLDVSRINRDRLTLKRRPVALAGVVADALEQSRPLIDAAGHRLEVDLPAAPVVLDADPTRIAQVLANLLNNAAKYTPAGGRIRLAAAREGGQVRLSVADTGVGIPAEQLPHVFEMFAQLTPALDRTQGGLGIGLALVRGLVGLHGGTVEALSGGPGAGSEFVVRLPALPAGTPVPDRPRPASPAPAPAAAGRRVLVVDDNEDAARTLARFLRLRGHQTRSVHDGPEALDAAEAFGPDAVLLDLGLPGLSGYEVARRLRARPGGDRLLLVAVSGWGQEADRRRSREAGFDHHLVKPADPDQIAALLARAEPADAP